MNILHVIIYAVVQGISEFLPISSSAHVALIGRFLDLPPLSAPVEAAINLGSLLVLITFFWRYVWKMIIGLLHVFSDRQTDEKYLFINLFLASIPAIVVGFFLHATKTRPLLQTFPVMAWGTTVFGLLMLVADRRMQTHTLENITTRQAFMGWGLAQCLAFLGGVSRSGILLTFGRFLAFKRYDTVLFTFLMAIPCLKGAVVLLGWSFMQGKLEGTPYPGDFALVAAVLTSFLVGFLTVRTFIKGLVHDWLQRIALYRVGLGLFLLFGLYVLGWA